MGTITDVGNAHNSPRMVLRGPGRWPSVTDGQDHRVENNVELDLMVTSLSQCPLGCDRDHVDCTCTVFIGMYNNRLLNGHMFASIRRPVVANRDASGAHGASEAASPR